MNIYRRNHRNSIIVGLIAIWFLLNLISTALVYIFELSTGENFAGLSIAYISVFRDVVIQTLVFGFLFFLLSILTGKQKISMYSFSIILTIGLHLYFFRHFDFQEQIFMVEYPTTLGTIFIMQSINFLSIFVTENLTLDGGYLWTRDLITFYLKYVFLPSVYLVTITCIALKIRTKYNKTSHNMV